MFLTTATGTLAGLAGCTSALNEFGASGDSADATSEKASADGAGSDPSQSHSNDERSLVYASNETTSFGIDLQDNPVLGSPDANLDCYYWSDYQCPFCKKFEQNTFPKLVDNYVKPGKLRVVILDNPYIGEGSETAARMAKCVWRQVRNENPTAFKRWHSTMFGEQGKENSGWAKKANLLEITRDVQSIDVDSVRSCLDKESKSLNTSIDADVQAAEKNGIRGTPAFIFFDRKSGQAGKIVGAQPYSLFKKAIRKVDNA